VSKGCDELDGVRAMMIDESAQNMFRRYEVRFTVVTTIKLDPARYKAANAT
jgi:hypothetical protein